MVHIVTIFHIHIRHKTITRLHNKQDIRGAFTPPIHNTWTSCSKTNVGDYCSLLVATPCSLLLQTVHLASMYCVALCLDKHKPSIIIARLGIE